MIDVMRLWPPPVGVALLRSADEHGSVTPFSGVSYCEAVHQAGEGEAVRVLRGSILVCQWAPVVLGLKLPSGSFEQNLAPRLGFPSAGLLLARLDTFPGEPDVVLLRSSRQVLDSLVQTVGRQVLWQDHHGRLDWSAVPLFAGESMTFRHHAVGQTNATLALLARSRRWQAITHRLFRSSLITAAFDKIISRWLPDMSLCRNSTVIPLRSGKVNISFFCTGGITWGRSNPEHMTSGWPWAEFQKLLVSAP